jgi:hypothetical protein
MSARLLVAFMLLGVPVALWEAHAADNTRYISTAGDNLNACTLAAPCRSLQRAISVTPGGGEIRILDSGFFGNNATIKKSLTISGDGNTVYLGDTITIDDADAVVALRGLVLNGQGTVVEGIEALAAKAVHIERCVIHRFTGNGIDIRASGVKLFVIDSTSRDNSVHGLFVGAAGSRVTIDNSRFENNGQIGASLFTGSTAVIYRSSASGNGGDGIFAGNASVGVISTTAAQNGQNGFHVSNGGRLAVEYSLAHGNGASGLSVNAPGNIARISNSAFNSNATGISNGGTVETRQNNTVRGNTTTISGNAPMIIGGV